MPIQQTINTAVTLFNGSGLITQLAIVLVVTAIAHYVEKVLYHRLLKKSTKTKSIWNDAVLFALHKPLVLFIWLLGLSILLEVLRLELNGAALFSLLDPVRKFAFIAILLWFALRLIGASEASLIAKKPKGKVDQTSVQAIAQLARAMVLVSVLLILLQTYGISISGVLALGGAGSVIMAFTAKDLLANFFGGLMIYYDRPFKVGDWIRSPDRAIEGTVEHIGWRLCRIRTFDKRPLYVPNSAFATIVVENPSRMHNRRIKTHIGVRYDDAPKIKAIITDIKHMLLNHPEIDTQATLMVNLVEFAPSALNILVYTFTKTTKWVEFQAIQEDVFLKIIDIIAKSGAEYAFPTTTMHIPAGIKLNSPKEK